MEEPIPDYLKPAIETLSQAVKAGWPSAAFSTAHIHVGIDAQARDVIFFELKDMMGATSTIECAPDETPAAIQKRAHDAWANISRATPVTRGAAR